MSPESLLSGAQAAPTPGEPCVWLSTGLGLLSRASLAPPTCAWQLVPPLAVGSGCGKGLWRTRVVRGSPWTPCVRPTFQPCPEVLL